MRAGGAASGSCRYVESERPPQTASDLRPDRATSSAGADAWCGRGSAGVGDDGVVPARADSVAWPGNEQPAGAGGHRVGVVAAARRAVVPLDPHLVPGEDAVGDGSEVVTGGAAAPALAGHVDPSVAWGRHGAGVVGAIAGTVVPLHPQTGADGAVGDSGVILIRGSPPAASGDEHHPGRADRDRGGDVISGTATVVPAKPQLG